MALQSSGTITLDDIHVEAGGSTTTQASLNDSDIRGLIGASSASEMDFADFYGASASASFVGAVTRAHPYEASIDSASEAVNLTGAGVQVGDLVVVAMSSDSGQFTSMAIEGMSMTQAYNPGGSSPTALVYYGTWASGNSNIYLNGSGNTNTNRMHAMTLVAAIFRNTSSSLLASYSRLSSSGLPNPYYIGGSYNANRSIIICSGHLDDDEVVFSAPSGFTMAGSAKTTSATRGSYTGSSTGIAYKLTTSYAAEYIGAFGSNPSGASDANHAFTMRF